MSTPSYRKLMLKIFGRPTFIWMAIGSLSAVGMAGAEIGIAATLQIIFASLGTTVVDANLAHSGWSNWLRQNFNFTVLLFFALGVVRATLQFVIGWSSGIAERYANAQLKQLALGTLMLNRDVSSPSVGALIFQMDTVFGRGATFINIVASLIPQLIVALGLIIALTWVNWGMGVFAVSVVFVIGLIIRHAGEIVQRQSELQMRPMFDFVVGLGRVTRNWFFVRVMKAQATEYARLSGLNTYSTSFSNRAHFGATIVGAFPAIGGVGVLAVLMVLQYRYSIGNGAVFLQFVYLLTRLVQSLTGIAGLLGHLATYRPSFDETVKILGLIDEAIVKEAVRPLSYISVIRRPRERRLPRLDPRDAVKDFSNSTVLPSISLRQISFSYDSITEVVSGLNMEIKSGEQVGIIGSSGSGKSTLMSIILGLQRPTSGDITIDGIAPEEYLDREVSTVGYVGAEPFLIEGTVKENLDYGQRFIYSESDYIFALQQARLTAVIKQLSGGLQHRLTENGEGLSAGEKQRVALARALLRKPRLLILDEVTANLDGETEHEIAVTLRALKGHCTCVIVSHRSGILKFADRVFDLDKKALAPHAAA